MYWDRDAVSCNDRAKLVCGLLKQPSTPIRKGGAVDADF